MTRVATLAFQDECATLSFDVNNASNSLYRDRVPPALGIGISNALTYAASLMAEHTQAASPLQTTQRKVSRPCEVCNRDTT